MKKFLGKFKNIIKIVLMIVVVIALMVIVWTIHKQNQSLETEYQVIQQLRAENENLVLINDLLIKKLKKCQQLNVNNQNNDSFYYSHFFVFSQPNFFSSNMFNYMQ